MTSWLPSIAASLGLGAAIWGGILAPGLVASTPTISAQLESSPQQYNLLGVSFQTPVPFSAPQAITEGVAVVYPPAAAPGEHELMVGIMTIPGMDSILSGLSTVEFMNYLRYSLGTAPLVNAATPINRFMFGRRLAGEALVKNPADPIYQEFYIVRLSNGSRLGIKLEAGQQVPLEQIETVFSRVAASFEELDPKSRAWRQSMEWWKHPSAAMTPNRSALP